MLLTYKCNSCLATFSTTSLTNTCKGCGSSSIDGLPAELYPSAWEQIKTDCGSLWRLKVPGGWLVKSIEEVNHAFPDGRFESGWDWRPAMTFVPDPSHIWTLEAL